MRRTLRAFDGFSVGVWGIVAGYSIYGCLVRALDSMPLANRALLSNGTSSFVSSAAQVSLILKHLDVFAKQFSVQISERPSLPLLHSPSPLPPFPFLAVLCGAVRCGAVRCGAVRCTAPNDLPHCRFRIGQCQRLRWR